MAWNKRQKYLFKRDVVGVVNFLWGLSSLKFRVIVVEGCHAVFEAVGVVPSGIDRRLFL